MSDPRDIPRQTVAEAPAKEPVAVQAPVVPPKRSASQRFLPLDAVVAPMCYKAEAGTTLQDVTNPEFWVSLTRRLQKNMQITVVSDDGGLDCDLRVVNVQPSYAEVVVLRASVEQVKFELENVEVKWNVGSQKYDVHHNGKRVRDAFQTKESAERFAEDYRNKRGMDFGKAVVN